MFKYVTNLILDGDPCPIEAEASVQQKDRRAQRTRLGQKNRRLAPKPLTEVVSDKVLADGLGMVSFQVKR